MDGLKDVTIENDEVMVSFDVEVLVTSVPVHVACEEARSKLEEELGNLESFFSGLLYIYYMS